MLSGARVFVLLAIVSLAGCGGGGGGGSTSAAVPAAPNAAQSSSWVAGLRYEPTTITASMSSPIPPYMYVDSGSTNGVYPAPDAFAAQIQSANPGLLSGACSAIARMTAQVMQFTDSHGVQAPSYVVFFWPKAVGTCTQSINVGAAGTQSFSVTVTP